MKIKIVYSYDGSKFLGSQTQTNKLAVEDKLNYALEKMGIFQKVISSSRTDRNVHALNQVSTTTCMDFWDLEKLKKFLNKYTYPNLYIKSIQKIDENFQVQFDAKARLYRYILCHDNFNPFLSNYFNYHEKPDIEILNQNLSNFIGEHDFKNFMKSGNNKKTTIRTIYKSYAYRYKNFTIIIFKSSGFLRTQVRMMVSNALKATFENKTDEFKTLFEEEKCLTRIPANPNGLYLTRIFY